MPYALHGVIRRAFLILLFFLTPAAEVIALAQIGYPGGYPPGGYPPGGYPPGGYPYPGGGGIGFPMPRRNKKDKQDQSKRNDQAALQNLSGILRRIDDKAIVLEAQDTRILNIKRFTDTKFHKNSKEIQASDFNPGDHVTVTAKQDTEGYFYAVDVTFLKAGTPEERARASQPVEASTGSSETDDERPILRRKDQPQDEAARPPAESASSPAAGADRDSRQQAGEEEDVDVGARNVRRGPATIQVPDVPDREDERPITLKRGWSKDPKDRQAPAPQETAARIPSGANPPGPAAASHPEPGVEVISNTQPRDPVIARARAAAAQFTETLPNYVCQERIARFVTTAPRSGWQPVDVVSAEVVYEAGRERYRNLTINGKATAKSMEQLPGSWSTGEFGSMLVDLFSPATDADFQYRKQDAVSGVTALVYDFQVDRENSHWHIQVASQSVVPAYQGSVWIDKATGRVLRIEAQARHLPREFPLDKVESAIDYQYVRLGGEQQYLLPVRAESLSCQRGTSICSHNTIDFRNYHKYTSDSEVIFTPPRP
jgi:hypothetical protein